MLVKFFSVKLCGRWVRLIVDPFRFEFSIQQISEEPAPWAGIETISKDQFNFKIKNLIVAGYRLIK